MNHRDAVQALSQCQGKDKFTSRRLAELTISERLRHKVTAYQCGICKQWHIGSVVIHRKKRLSEKQHTKRRTNHDA